MINDDKLYESPSTFCVEGNTVWGIHAKLNYLFSYNLSTKLVERYNLYPYTVIGKESYYIGICKYENNVYLVPCWGSKIISYNIAKKTIKVLEEGSNINGRFGKSFVIEDKLYCVPMYEDFFLVVDIKNGCIEEKIPWKYMISKKDPVIIDSFIFNNKIVCLIKDCSEEVILLDNNFNIERQKIQNKGEKLTTGCSSEGSMFLCNPKTGMIFRYDKKFIIQETIRVKGFFSAILNSINNILILDNVEQAEKSLYFIDDKQEKFKSSHVEKSSLSYTGMHGLLYYYNGVTFYFERAKNELYVIDKNNKYETIKIEIDRQKADDIIKSNMHNEKFIIENDIANLEFFIECMVGEII